MIRLIINRYFKDSYSSDKSKTYVISEYNDGSWACSCPSWIFKKGHKLDCKHIYEVKNDLAYKHQNNLIENISYNLQGIQPTAEKIVEELDINKMVEDFKNLEVENGN